MRQCEFKKHYDPEMDLHVGKHIYGEGITDIFKSVGSKLFGKTMKEAAKTAVKTAATKAATKTGEYAGKKAGDKIVELLSKKKVEEPSIPLKTYVDIPLNLEEPEPEPKPKPKPKPKTKPKTEDSDKQEINKMVNQILLGGKLRRRNFI